MEEVACRRGRSSRSIRGGTALVCSGGGARGAYQAGVIKAIAEVTSTASRPLPFNILSGVSAGSVNTAFIAASAKVFRRSAQMLAGFWTDIDTRQVFRTDVWSLGSIGVNWALQLVGGGRTLGSRVNSLLDTAPLRKTLTEKIQFARINENLRSGLLHAVTISATDCTSSESVAFVQSAGSFFPWSKLKRRSEKSEININHVMASSAIPLFFPPVRIAGRMFTDGCLRNSTPLSPAIKLGAEKICAISVRSHRSDKEIKTRESASTARILGLLLDAVILDAVDTDMERLRGINKMLLETAPACRESLAYQKIDTLCFRPSEDPAAVAVAMQKKLPDPMRYLLAGLGAANETAVLASYLMFEREFCRYLVDLGYRDAMARRDEMADFLAPPSSKDLTS